MIISLALPFADTAPELVNPATGSAHQFTWRVPTLSMPTLKRADPSWARQDNPTALELREDSVGFFRASDEKISHPFALGYGRWNLSDSFDRFDALCDLDHPIEMFSRTVQFYFSGRLVLRVLGVVHKSRGDGECWGERLNVVP